MKAFQMHHAASMRVAVAKTYVTAPTPPIRLTAAATPFSPPCLPTTPVCWNSSCVKRTKHGPICYYTSMPERMGEQDDNPSASVPHLNPDEQHKADEARRQRDAAAQEQAMHVLQDLEAAAVTANPEAGHPENRRMLSTVDYPAPEPPATQNNSPWHSQVQDTTAGINAFFSSSNMRGSEGPVEGSHLADIDSANFRATDKANDSIYDDDAPFVAWFEDP